ncbi:MAG TPA: dihydrolipoyllysine-residue acetyltransferase [Myxococcales bacterium]|nr:dihydrolipoyllysine-residue acetyltransferase [Myxococcales bacterium]
MDVLVPDIGDFKDVPVIEVLVKPGDKVEKESPLVTLESDKATLDVPSPAAGTVKEVKVKAGDKVSQGTLIVTLDAAGEARAATPSKPAAPEQPVAASRGGTPPPEQAQPEKPYAGTTPRKDHGGPTETVPPPAPSLAPPVDEAAFVQAHAGPGVRALARELGVDLGRVKGSGPKSRILREDVQAFVKSVLSGTAAAPVAAAAGGLGVAPWPKVDFAKYGPVETKPLTRIQKIAGPGLHRNWVTIPHVTSCEDADITGLEAFRVALNKEQDVKVTLLAFLMKACVSALMKFPNFNCSLEDDHLVLKKYYNLGFAADTPQGLLVPVVKDADKKGVLEIARETAELALKAREGKLQPGEMQGATFTISSLGGIGGTYFTPIINAPEVAILGVCRAAMRPVWDGAKFEPRLMLPLSLSWDHRVLDGAAAGRFNAHLAAMLGDARRMLL